MCFCDGCSDLVLGALDVSRQSMHSISARLFIFTGKAIDVMSLHNVTCGYQRCSP